MCEHAAGLPFARSDLPPLEPIAAWRTERNRRGGGRPVLGRMLRFDDDRLPAGRDNLLAAHPAEPDLEMRFLGGEAALAGLVKPLPPAWRIFPREAISARRFLARLDLYVHHQDEPQRQFPRGALQAMAAGRVVTLGPGFKAVLGPGPAYREPDQVAETARYLQAEPRFYDRYVAEQDAALAERFGPQALWTSWPSMCACRDRHAPRASDAKRADRLLPDQRRGPGPCHPTARDRAPAPARLRAGLLHPLPRAVGDRACRLPDRVRARAGP